MSAGSVWIESRTVGGVKKHRVVWRVNKQKDRSAWTPLYGHAKAAKAAKIAELSAGTLGVVVRENPTVLEFKESYLNARRMAKRAERTVKNFDERTLTMFANFKGEHGLTGALRVTQVSPKIVESWLMDLDRQGAEANGLAIHFRTLRTAFSYAVKMRMIPENPVSAVEEPTEEEVGRRLTPAEVQLILSNAPEELVRTATFALHTGFRIGEVMALDWKMVNRAGPVWIATVKTDREAGLKGSFKRKTRKGMRVPIPPAAQAVMGEPKAEGRVYPYPISTIQHQLSDLVEFLEMGRVRFHDFRHTFLSEFFDRGGSPLTIIKSGLITDLRTLERYTHINDDVLASQFCRVSYVAPTEAPKAETASPF